MASRVKTTYVLYANGQCMGGLYRSRPLIVVSVRENVGRSEEHRGRKFVVNAER